MRRQLLPFLLLLPALVLIGVMDGYPIGRLFATSFQQLGLQQLFSHKVIWNGLANYRTLFSSSQLGTSVLQTVIFVLACVGLTMLLGTSVALLLGRIGKVFRTVVSVCMLLAWAMPTSASSIVWTWLFETEWGVVNYILTTFGFHYANHNWFGSTISAYSIIVANIVWGGSPLWPSRCTRRSPSYPATFSRRQRWTGLRPQPSSAR